MKPIRISCTPSQPNRLQSNLPQNNEFARKKVADFVNGLSLSQTLYIHGQSGVGKTHLINQMLSSFADSNKGIKVLNAHCFVLNILNAIKSNNLESYRRSLKHYRFVIIEDIDLFSFKQRSQAEFLDAIEYVLSHDHLKIIVTGQSHPSKLLGINWKQLNLLHSCVVVKIASPMADENKLFIHSFVHKHRIQISEKAIEYLCFQAADNYFLLLDTLNTLKLYYEHTNSPITVRSPEFFSLLWCY